MKKGKLSLVSRNIIPNDSKLFAQADLDNTVTHFITSDRECSKVFEVIKENLKPKFDIINIRTPYNETYGLLDFEG